MTYAQLMRDKHIWVIRLRYVVTAVLAGSFLLSVPLEQLLTVNLNIPILALAGIVLLVFAANFIWIILLKRDDISHETVGYWQCILDLLVVSLLVHQHGASGLMGYLFILVILVAGVLLQRKGIVLIAAISSVTYLLLLLLETYGWTVPLPDIIGGVKLLPENVQFLIDVCMKVFFFYIVALSCANMQDLLAKTAKESEFMAEFNKEIIEMVPVGVMVVDMGRNIVLFNPTMERTTFIKSDQAMGNPVTEVFKGLDESWNNAFTQSEEKGEEVRLLGTSIPIPGGKMSRANVRMQPLKVNNQTLGTVCIIQSAAR